MMELRAVKAHEIPVHLLRQKESWDLEVFYELAVTDPQRWMAFLLEDEGETVGAVLYGTSRLYRAVLVDSLIVDEAHRSMSRMREALDVAREMGHILARELGFPQVMATTEWSVDAMKRLHGEEFRGRVIETTVSEEV